MIRLTQIGRFQITNRMAAVAAAVLLLSAAATAEDPATEMETEALVTQAPRAEDRATLQPEPRRQKLSISLLLFGS
ncbi:MAG: hypothetical protein R3348_03660 [Xanthomonadales bacterium]|nr:hypothetical protein [Xanthomonadales bacterium]